MADSQHGLLPGSGAPAAVETDEAERFFYVVGVLAYWEIRFHSHFMGNYYDIVSHAQNVDRTAHIDDVVFQTPFRLDALLHNLQYLGVETANVFDFSPEFLEFLNDRFDRQRFVKAFLGMSYRRFFRLADRLLLIISRPETTVEELDAATPSTEEILDASYG